MLRRLLADAQVGLAIATVAPVLVMEVTHFSSASTRTVVASVIYLAAQLILSRLAGVRARSVWQVWRFALATLFVALLMIFDGATSATLPVLFVPIVALAAAMGARAGTVIASLAVVLGTCQAG